MKISLQALYHAESLENVTMAKLQKKLEGKISLHTVRKLIDKMSLNGFLEAKSSGKLGRCYFVCIKHKRLSMPFFLNTRWIVIIVLFSRQACYPDRKFEEVKRALDRVRTSELCGLRH